MSAIDFGLSDIDLDILRNDVHFIIHAASTIHLRMKLRELSYSVIAPSIWLARLAFSSKKLERFVFISTAYCNAHLWQIQKDTDDVLIKENIYPLLEGENPFLHAPQAWQDIQKLGQTEEFARNDFPWGYAYAKHLTERLLLFFASQKESMHKLLIVRPSIIGPAQEHPFVGFSTATSTPTTSCATAFVLHPGRSMVFASRLPDGSLQSTIDEVPIDVVVDRTLAHLALGTNGCVHAVGGRKTRVTIDEWARANNDERRIPWDVKVKWIDADWNSKEVCQLARIFKIIGTNYGFDESKTESIDSQLVGHDLKLFADRKPYEVASRRGMIRELGIDMAKRKGWPVWFIKLLARKAKQNGDIIMIGDIEVASEKKL